MKLILERLSAHEIGGQPVDTYLRDIHSGRASSRLQAFRNLASEGELHNLFLADDFFEKFGEMELGIGLLKLKIFALVDHSEARKIWRHILKNHTKKAIWETCFPAEGESRELIASPHQLLPSLQALLKGAELELNTVLEEQFPQEAVWKDFDRDRDPGAERTYTQGFLRSSGSSSQEKLLIKGNIERYFKKN